MAVSWGVADCVSCQHKSFRSLPEHQKVNLVRNSAMPRVIGMEGVAAVISWEIAGGASGVVGGAILIDYRVAAAFSTTQEGIDLFANDLSGWGPVVRPFIRGQRRTEELN